MKITRANVAEYAQKCGLEPVQIDGIPEGFSFKQPGITVGSSFHEGEYIAFVPLREWEDEKSSVRAITVTALQTLFKRSNGK